MVSEALMGKAREMPLLTRLSPWFVRPAPLWRLLSSGLLQIRFGAAQYVTICNWNEIENLLIASCSACNLGQSARSVTVVPKSLQVRRGCDR